MHVFVTGGAGYIGSICVEQLLNAGHAVTVFDNLSEGHRSAVDARAAFVQGSIGDPKDIFQAIKDSNPETVIHFAAHALVGESMVNPGDLIFRGQSVSGYWVSREFQDRSLLGLLRISRFLRSARRLLTTDLQSTAQAHVPLEDIATSLPKLMQSTSRGKIYIRPGG